MIDSMLDILLVEDNSYDVELTLDALKTHNLANRVRVLRDGEEAINHIFGQESNKDKESCEHPKLILLDLNLPKIDGLEILKRIRSDRKTRAIPVVVLTSSVEDQDRIESYKLGVNSYIVKPVDFDSFTRAVAEIGFYWVLLNKAP
jgi:two-component system response regulator